MHSHIPKPSTTSAQGCEALAMCNPPSSLLLHVFSATPYSLSSSYSGVNVSTHCRGPANYAAAHQRGTAERPCSFRKLSASEMSSGSNSGSALNKSPTCKSPSLHSWPSLASPTLPCMVWPWHQAHTGLPQLSLKGHNNIPCHQTTS